MAKYRIVIEDVNEEEATVQLECLAGKNENTQAANIAGTAMDVIKALVRQNDEQQETTELPRQKIDSDLH
jgi:hypothetical protein